MDDLQVALGVLRDLLSDGGWIGWSEYGCCCNYCGAEIHLGTKTRPAKVDHASDCAYVQGCRTLAELDREPVVRFGG